LLYYNLSYALYGIIIFIFRNAILKLVKNLKKMIGKALMLLVLVTY
jgi:hypothetical protein